MQLFELNDVFLQLFPWRFQRLLKISLNMVSQIKVWYRLKNNSSVKLSPIHDATGRPINVMRKYIMVSFLDGAPGAVVIASDFK